MIRIKHNPSPTSKLLVGAAIKPELPLVSEILERYLETKGDDNWMGAYFFTGGIPEECDRRA